MHREMLVDQRRASQAGWRDVTQNSPNDGCGALRRAETLCRSHCHEAARRADAQQAHGFAPGELTLCWCCYPHVRLILEDVGHVDNAPDTCGRSHVISCAFSVISCTR